LRAAGAGLPARPAFATCGRSRNGYPGGRGAVGNGKGSTSSEEKSYLAGRGRKPRPVFALSGWRARASWRVSRPGPQRTRAFRCSPCQRFAEKHDLVCWSLAYGANGGRLCARGSGFLAAVRKGRWTEHWVDTTGEQGQHTNLYRRFATSARGSKIWPRQPE
jgi:hypothetical protein